MSTHSIESDWKVSTVLKITTGPRLSLRRQMTGEDIFCCLGSVGRVQQSLGMAGVGRSLGQLGQLSTMTVTIANITSTITRQKQRRTTHPLSRAPYSLCETSGIESGRQIPFSVSAY